jgi:hypothetical protein
MLFNKYIYRSISPGILSVIITYFSKYLFISSDFDGIYYASFLASGRIQSNIKWMSIFFLCGSENFIICSEL